MIEKKKRIFFLVRFILSYQGDQGPPGVPGQKGIKLYAEGPKELKVCLSDYLSVRSPVCQITSLSDYLSVSHGNFSGRTR